MSENCSSNCSSCKKECNSRKEPNQFLEPMNEFSNIKKVIGVVSGKGGVGKSLITSLLASEMSKRGSSVAILDADITGPSIPKLFGINVRPTNNGDYLNPPTSESGIKVMSLNLLMESTTDPVVWRGPIIAGTVKQFWSEVVWGDVDYMFVDMPPGTGDVPLTVFQSLPLAGIVIVTSPQDLVSMIVEKAVKMAEIMSVPILGIVENMSYFKCPDCGKEHHIFGESHVDDIANKYGIKAVAKLPMDADFAKLCDNGQIESHEEELLTDILNALQ